MSNDWTDPDEAERELTRREASNGDPDRSAQHDCELMLEIREELKELKTENASLREDIASLRDEVARREDERSAPSRPPTEDVLGKQLAETEGRIVAHVDRHEETVRPVVAALPDFQKTARIAAAVPESLGKLDATVARQTEAVRGHTQESRSNSTYLGNLGVELKDMVRDNGLRLEAAFAAEAKETREWHKEVIATVRKGRIRRHYRAQDAATPYEKLKSLPDPARFLKPGVSFEALDALAHAQSDLDAARDVVAAREELFRTLGREWGRAA